MSVGIKLEMEVEIEILQGQYLQTAVGQHQRDQEKNLDINIDIQLKPYNQRAKAAEIRELVPGPKIKTVLPTDNDQKPYANGDLDAQRDQNSHAAQRHQMADLGQDWRVHLFAAAVEEGHDLNKVRNP